MCRVFLAGLRAVTLLALLAADLISINLLHKSLREAIEVREAVESSESDIIVEVVRCKVEENNRGSEFRRPINPESVIGPAGPSGRSPVDLIMVKSIVIFTRQ
jgi:recombinational DNA repair protein RecT